MSEMLRRITSGRKGKERRKRKYRGAKYIKDTKYSRGAKREKKNRLMYSYILNYNRVFFLFSFR